MDVRIAHTVAYLLRCPQSSVSEAMRVCKFTFDESASRSKQMTIYRSFAKEAAGGKFVPPPRCYRHGDSCDDDSVAADKSNVYGQRRSIDADDDAPRTLTPRTTPGGTQSTRPNPKQRLIRKLAGGMQKFQINKLAASNHAKRALKRATKWYAKEKNKTGFR